MKVRNSKINNLIEVDLKSRRMFLKSAGGLSLAIPFMPALLFSDKALAAVTPPLRYVQLFTPHGGLMNKNWYGSNLPTTNYALYANQNARVNALSSLVSGSGLSPTLGTSFNNLWPSINLIAGADQPVYFGHNRTVGVGAFCQNHTGTAAPSDQLDLSGIIGETPSIDQVFGYAGNNGIYAGAMGSRKRFLNIKAGNGMGETCSWGRNNYFNLNDPVIGRDYLNSNAGIFSALFGSVPASTTTTTTSANPLLNLVNEFWASGKSLMSQLSASDKSILDQLFQMAQDASTKYTPTTTQGPTCSPVKPASTNSSWDTNGVQLQVMADIISMAFKCDITRVVSIFVGDGICAQNWHDLAHGSETDSAQTELIKIHKQIADNFVARLGNNLNVADPLDNSSTILKNSLTLWTQENKVQHDCWNTPTLLMGGAGGRINTGLFADLQDTAAAASLGQDANKEAAYMGDLINRLWISMFYGMGINKADYEITRGGGKWSPVASTGYGHVLNNPDSWHATPRNYNLTKIAEPWEFLKKSTTSWS